ncbi:endolytic transglycosylase MltG [Hymenobacter rubripertinctus]|uniref:endolytic transglycosylase MltG n=1 Tax=Hymenobacter rubripertinctus TaxID=2029981 RepID=UPI0015FEEC6C|nr:endolytic transglycosylase MltG [Hymenobacter rubripertinctus]
MRKFWLIFLLTLSVAVLAGLGAAWQLLWRPNVRPSAFGPAYLYIGTGSNYGTVLDSLRKYDLLRSQASFEWVAHWLNYPQRVKPGRYLLEPGLGNQALVEMLSRGEQDTVAFTLNAFKYKPQLARQLAAAFETDSVSLRRLLNDNDLLRRRYQVDTTTVLTLFLPGPYRLLWNTSARQLLDSAAATHQRFWTAERRRRADSLGLTPTQVHVLASIVQRETAQPTDKFLIAGAYLNRLRKGMRLQADPTLLWAIGNFGVKRVLNADKLVDSPYNTYKHKGLPPGPITSANRQTLDAVLRPARHNYVFFCARPDGSGFSDFAETYVEHLRNARRYQHRLDSLGVKR